MQRFLINLLLLFVVLGALFFFSPISKVFNFGPPTSEVEIMMEPDAGPAEDPATETPSDSEVGAAVDEAAAAEGAEEADVEEAEETSVEEVESPASMDP